MNVFNELSDIKIKDSMGLINMTDEFFCLFVKSIFDNKGSNILIIVNSLYDANSLYNIMQNYDVNVQLFPMDDFLTSEALAISPDLTIKRLETLNSVVSHDKNIVITNLMGYLRFLPAKENYINSVINLKVGDLISPSALIDKLISIGYVKDTLVNKTGEIGVRGFVVDIFPIDEERPIRVEFFDDEIESIRIFDENSQKSIKAISEILIMPCSEFICNKSVDSEHIGKQKYLPNYTSVVNISEYLNNCITFFKDYNVLELSYNNLCEEIEIYRTSKDLTFNSNYMFELDKIKNQYPLYYFSVDNLSSYKYVVSVHNFNIKSIRNFNEDAQMINDYINSNIHSGRTVIICVKKYQIRSLYKFLNMQVYETTFNNIKKGRVNIVVSDISNGFVYEDIIFLSSNELFNLKVGQKNYKTKYKYSSAINDINKLNVGDYIVHSVHGIGRYNGIKTLSSNNMLKDYLEILYQGKDKIYIPVEKIDVISKYSGREGVVPKINRLSGNDWHNTKNRVKQRVNKMADQLLKLYAEREEKKGFAFSKDCDMLLDFEKDFPYQLTIDQATAIQQIKSDMEKSSPMDRLLCGDVGFGKTEVAFVAAFKAILDSKQVLFLCPTTILSNQHYVNAIERFNNYPVNIKLLNRFSSTKDVSLILNGLRSGTVDMVIGTHRLLSNDIVLKDLGLLIIDEEQRFGVAHKEKIKQYKTNVDVLTLTATPIPRTLQMSLVGIRSLSLLSTPPVNRYPVQTYVLEENDQILKDAIYKELSRNGQVFLLYNRVQMIDEYASKVIRLIPDAKVAVAHGQMSKSQLENTIIDFIDHKYDILICTTIIETGIDIPNVNTLIIINADQFGLSQLYQIRGRVGRSDKFAYAYLMYKPARVLTETAMKRLNVIKEFTELGSGFSIATRDLSIRGAGDILGSEQAGFIDSVGIELYMKMLNDEISRKKNNIIEDDEDINETSPLLNVSTHISDNYVLDDDLKIDIHKMINSIDSYEKLITVKEIIEDRFGKVNEDMIVYMYEELFEKLVEHIGISKVRQSKNSIEMVFDRALVSKINVDELFMLSFKISPMFRFLSRGSNLVIILDVIKLEKHPIYYLVELLNEMNNNSNIFID